MTEAVYPRPMTLFDHPAKRLAQLMARYTAQPGGLSSLNPDQATQIMRHVRRLIEREDIGVDFPTARLFGDWLQHNELNNTTVRALIEQLNAEIAASSAIDLIVPNLLGMHTLRGDLIAIFDRFSLADDLLETASLWMRFGALVLEEIAETPLKFPAVNSSGSLAAQALARIHQASKDAYGEPGIGGPLWFDSLVIEAEPDEQGYFLWRLEFAVPGEVRAGVRGRVISTDSRPFRDNDLNISYTSDVAVARKALDRLYEPRPQQRIVDVASATED